MCGAAAVVGVVREFMASDGFGLSLSDSRYLALVVFATIAASTLVVRGAVTGWGRTGLGVLAGLATVGGAVSFFSVTDFEAACFYITAAIAVGSGVLILVSAKIVHMAFWLLASLAGCASVYLLLGAGVLGFGDLLRFRVGALFDPAQTYRVAVAVALLVFATLLTPARVVGEALGASGVNMRFVKPLDEGVVLEMASSHDLLVTVEENVIAGGAGAAVSEYLHSVGNSGRVLNLGLPDKHVEHGASNEILAECGLDADGMRRAIESAVPMPRAVESA